MKRILFDNINYFYLSLLIHKDGKLVNLIIDANAPRLMKLITDEVELYDKFKKGEIQREFVSTLL